MKSYLGYIYKITLPDGRYYFGKREKSNILSYYFGGGRIINDWFIKHTGYSSKCCPKHIAESIGIKRDILFFVGNKYCLECVEKIVIGNLYKNNKKCLNLCAGGNTRKDRKLTKETREKISLANKGRIVKESTRKLISISNSGRIGLKGVESPRYGKKHTEETKLKMRQNHADFSGDKSPSFGRKLTELQKIQISKTHKGRHWYNNGKTCIFAYNCPEGYIKGRKYD